MGSLGMSIQALNRFALLMGLSLTSAQSALAQGSVNNPTQATRNQPANSPLSSSLIVPGNVIATSNPNFRRDSTSPALTSSSDSIKPGIPGTNSTIIGGGQVLPPLGSGTNLVNPSDVTPVSSTVPAILPDDSIIASSGPVTNPEPANHPFAPSGPFAPLVAGNHASLSVRIDGTAQAIAGEVLHYTIIVRNTGSIPLQEVRLEQRIPSGVTVASTVPQSIPSNNVLVWTLGKLEPNAERSIRIDIQPGTVEEFHLDPMASYKISNSLKTRVQQPPFMLTQVGPDSLERGSKGVVQLTVSNQGATPLHSIRLRVVLSPGLKHTQGAQIEATLDSLKAGEKRVLPLEILAIGEGPQSIAVVATSQEGPVSRSKHLIAVKEIPLILKASSASVAGTADTELQLQITNTTLAVVRNLRLVIQYPDRLEIHRVSHEGKLDLPNHLLHWSGLEELPPGKSMTVLAHFQVPQSGDWPLQIVLTGEGLPETRIGHVIRPMNSAQIPGNGQATESRR